MIQSHTHTELDCLHLLNPPMFDWWGRNPHSWCWLNTLTSPFSAKYPVFIRCHHSRRNKELLEQQIHILKPSMTRENPCDRTRRCFLWPYRTEHRPHLCVRRAEHLNVSLDAPAQYRVASTVLETIHFVNSPVSSTRLTRLTGSLQVDVSYYCPQSYGTNLDSRQEVQLDIRGDVEQLLCWLCLSLDCRRLLKVATPPTRWSWQHRQRHWIQAAGTRQ